MLCCKQKQESKEENFSFKKRIDTNTVKKVFDKKFLWPARPGCTYALRREWFLSIDKWWKDYLPHDAFLYRNAMLDDSLFFLESELIIRRIHEANTSIAHGSERFRINLQYYVDVCNLLLARLDNDNRIDNRDYKQKIIKEAINWINARKDFYHKTNLVTFIKLSSYYTFYIRFRAFVKELFIAKEMHKEYN